MLNTAALASFLGTIAREQTRGYSLRAAGWALLALGAVFAALFVGLALHLALADEVGGPAAALIVGVVALALTAVPATVLFSRARDAERRARAARIPALTTAGTAMSMKKLPLGRMLMFALVAGAGYEWLRRRR